MSKELFLSFLCGTMLVSCGKIRSESKVNPVEVKVDAPEDLNVIQHLSIARLYGELLTLCKERFKVEGSEMEECRNRAQDAIIELITYYGLDKGKEGKNSN